MSRLENGQPLSTPDMRRAVVPLFPQSSGLLGRCQPAQAPPVDAHVVRELRHSGA